MVRNLYIFTDVPIWYGCLVVKACISAFRGKWSHWIVANENNSGQTIVMIDMDKHAHQQTTIHSPQSLNRSFHTRVLPHEIHSWKFPLLSSSCCWINFVGNSCKEYLIFPIRLVWCCINLRKSVVFWEEDALVTIALKDENSVFWNFSLCIPHFSYNFHITYYFACCIILLYHKSVKKSWKLDVRGFFFFLLFIFQCKNWLFGPLMCSSCLLLTVLSSSHISFKVQNLKLYIVYSL